MIIIISRFFAGETNVYKWKCYIGICSKICKKNCRCCAKCKVIDVVKWVISFFALSVSGSPVPTVSWVKDGASLRQRSGVSTRQEGSLHVLCLENAHITDTGQYGCSLRLYSFCFQFHIEIDLTFFFNAGSLEHVLNCRAVEICHLPCCLYKQVTEWTSQTGVRWRRMSNSLPQSHREAKIEPINVPHGYSGFVCSKCQGLNIERIA